MKSDLKKKIITILSIVFVVGASVLVAKFSSVGLFWVFMWVPAIFFSEEKNIASAIRLNPDYIYMLIFSVLFFYFLFCFFWEGEVLKVIVKDSLVLLVDLIFFAGFLAWRKKIFSLLYKDNGG